MLGSVVILTGPPGAGKSTVADMMARRSAEPAVHLHTDDFYDRFIKSAYVLPWLPESQKQNETVTNAIAAAAVAYARGGYLTIIDGIVGPWFLAPFRDAALGANVELHYVVIRPDSPDLMVARVQARNTHGLNAEEPIRDLYRQFSALGDYEASVFDPDGCDAEETAALLMGLIRRGKFRIAQ